MSLDLLSLAWCLASLGGAIVIGVLYTRSRNNRSGASPATKPLTHGESKVIDNVGFIYLKAVLIISIVGSSL